MNFESLVGQMKPIGRNTEKNRRISKKNNIFAGMILSFTIKDTEFPTITTIEQAEPWEEGHIVRIASPCFKKRFYKRLISSTLPPPTSNSRHELVSYCHSAAYTILPCKARALSGGIFCVFLLGLMLGFSACSKYAKVPEPVVAEPGRSIEGPTPKNAPAPNQGVSFVMDTTWLDDTVINIDPIAP